VNGSAYLDSLDLSSDNPTRLSVFVPANAGTSVSSASSGLLAGLDDGDILDFQSFHVESIPANVAAGSIGAGVNVTALFMR
jgi:hypothetical protein